LLPSFNSSFDIEHIFAKKRQENDKSLTNIKSLESLGNKVLLEEKINIRAADYRFYDKLKYYQGFVNDKGQQKEGTIIVELIDFVKSKSDFTEKDILQREQQIINQLILNLKELKLVQE
jgi:hypothetical protein